MLDERIVKNIFDWESHRDQRFLGRPQTRWLLAKQADLDLKLPRKQEEHRPKTDKDVTLQYARHT